MALRRVKHRTAPVITLVYLLALQFFYSWAWNSSDVLRPLYRRLYHLGLLEAGAAYSAQAAGALLGALMVGRLLHKAGRRPTLALIGVGCGTTLAAGVLVGNFAALLLQRAAMGLTMGAVFPVTVGMIVDLFPANQRGKLASTIDGTYFAAVVALGWSAAAWADLDWRLLFWPAGLMLVLIGTAAFLLAIPDHPHDRAVEAPRARELFAKGLYSRTIALTSMIAANACGHQAFTGWMTVYLREVEEASNAAVAATLSAQYVGSISGCLAWGFIVDGRGRRTGAIGLAGAGLFAALFILLPGPLLVKQLAVFGFGFSFAAVVTLGPWLAELYPQALRAPATSIFQWGRFVSLVAPPLTGLAAESVGLPLVMLAAALAFFASGVIWHSLPETHRRRPAAPRQQRGAALPPASR